MLNYLKSSDPWSECLTLFSSSSPSNSSTSCFGSKFGSSFNPFRLINASDILRFFTQLEARAKYLFYQKNLILIKYNILYSIFFFLLIPKNTFLWRRILSKSSVLIMIGRRKRRNRVLLVDHRIFVCKRRIKSEHSP